MIIIDYNKLCVFGYFLVKYANAYWYVLMRKWAEKGQNKFIIIDLDAYASRYFSKTTIVEKCVLRLAKLLRR